MKKKMGAMMLICCILAGLCACNEEDTVETLSSETEIENVVPGPYEEYVMDSMRGTTLSVKVPKSFLIYGENTIAYQSDDVIYLALNVNDGTNPEIEEKLSITLYEENGSISSNQTKFEYVTETLKDRYEFELVKETETENVHTLWIEGVDPDHDFKNRSSKMRMVVNYVTLEDVIICCVLECDYSLKEHEEAAGFEEFEKVVDSVVFEVVEPVANETIVQSETTEITAESTAPSETMENTTESTATESTSESIAPETSTESVPTTESSVTVETTYEKDDWKSAGFYIDGNYGKLPMKYDELEQLGFGELKFSTKSIDDTEDKDITHIEPLKSYKYGNLDAYNAEGEILSVSFANETETEQHVKDCTVYAIRFTRPDHEIRSGEEVELCNGLTWGSTYEEVISLMGEPGKKIDFTNEYGYNGDLYYYFDETDRGKYLELNFFKNELEGIYITAKPIK